MKNGETLDSLAARLIRERRVTFSFLREGSEGERLVVTVRECREYDMVGYDEPFVPGDSFDVGPAAARETPIVTTLRFETVQQAGLRVLGHRSELITRNSGTA